MGERVRWARERDGRGSEMAEGGRWLGREIGEGARWARGRDGLGSEMG